MYECRSEMGSDVFIFMLKKRFASSHWASVFGYFNPFLIVGNSVVVCPL